MTDTCLSLSHSAVDSPHLSFSQIKICFQVSLETVSILHLVPVFSGNAVTRVSSMYRVCGGPCGDSDTFTCCHN